MAKAKSSEKTTAPKAKSKTKTPAQPESAATPGVPAIDPTLAVQTAAALVAGGAARGIKTSEQQKESSAFKQMKQSLNKPHGSSMSNALNKTGGPLGKKSAQPFSGFGRQVGHNQTFGADVNRAGVPRRTGGG